MTALNTRRIVQAVLIADDLLKEYHAVVDQIATLRAAATMADTFAVLLGQANQVYAGVWEHLDEAAAELGAASRGIPGYPAVRAQHGHLGILDSTSSKRLSLGTSAVLGAVATEVTVAATANAVGARHAADMSQAFKRRLPDVDWQAARAAADAPIADIGSASGTRVVVAIAAIATAGLALLVFG